jgi:hypothetical protein
MSWLMLADARRRDHLRRWPLFQDGYGAPADTLRRDRRGASDRLRRKEAVDLSPVCPTEIVEGGNLGVRQRRENSVARGEVAIVMQWLDADMRRTGSEMSAKLALYHCRIAP